MSDRERDDRPGSANESSELPPRLFAQPGRDGELVRRYLRRPHHGAEELAWQRLSSATADAAWAPERRPRRLAVYAVLGLAGAASLATLALVASRRTAHGLAGSVAVGERRAVVTPAVRGAETSPTEDIELGSQPRVLEPGRWTIRDEASGELSPGGAARAERGPGGAPTVTLLAGDVSLAVVHKDRPALFRVASPPYAFTVLGTVFHVERGPTEIKLVVVEGRVAVSRAGRELTTVTGGGTWSGPLAPGVASKRDGTRAATVRAVALSSPDGARPAVAVARPCAAELPTSERSSCLRRQADGSGLAAETALYELAKLSRDELHDPAAALTLLEELRRRFSAGALRVETDLSIVELLARTGRYYQAIDESAALLARGGTGEREAELHLLRGNIYREALGDLTHAAAEYRVAADQASRRPTADEAAFLHAVATEALGLRSEAAELYQRYLARPRPLHEEDARRRLEGLLPAKERDRP